MTPDGDKEWAAMTSDNVGRTIAICMNEIVISAPSVRGAIKGGDTEISGSFTMAEAQDFSRILSIGNLPLPCAFVSIKKL
jgi:SecD/SecF fusion protein